MKLSSGIEERHENNQKIENKMKTKEEYQRERVNVK